MWYEKELLAQIQELKAENKRLEARYTQREMLKQMHDRLFLYVDTFGEIDPENHPDRAFLNTDVANALASHPADSDASMFVKQVQTDLINEMLSWKHGAFDATPFTGLQSAFYSFANEKGIKITEGE